MATDIVVIPREFNDLALSSIEKIALGLIWGFDRKNGVFYGSVAYLQEWLGCTKPTAIKTMKSLSEKGLIKKATAVIFGEVRNVYVINWEGLKNLTEVKNFNLAGKEILPNNIVDNISINSEIKKERTPAFRKPSVEEVREYCAERKNEINAEEFVDHYESNGWFVGKSKMKDWKAAVRNWERNRRKESPKPAPAKKEDPYTYNKRLLAETMARITGSTRKEDVDEQ